MVPETGEANDVTVLLAQAREGSAEARNQLVALLYHRFRSRAQCQLEQERPGHSLAATDLVDETLLRLLQYDELARAANRHQLFRAFARAMRQVLNDDARRRKAGKRGGDYHRKELDDLSDDLHQRTQSDVLALAEALDALHAEHDREARVLELRFFGGCEMAEISEVLGVSLRTVERDSRFGLAWLRDFLSPEA